jgi:hypothetical protein
MSLERNYNNQSEMSLLKLPDIKQYQKYSRDNGASDVYSLNYTDDKKAKLRSKLEQLYSIKMPLPKSK